MADDPNTFRVERTTAIAAPIDKVFEELADFHRWVDWSPWEGIDPAMARTYSGADAGVGAVYEWRGSRKVGEGRMEVTESDAPHSLGIQLDFIKPFKARNHTVFTLDQTGHGTEVNWAMTGRKTFMTKVMGIFSSMDKMVGKDFEKGLAQLKAKMEGSARPS
jgi:hypothetical protein